MRSLSSRQDTVQQPTAAHQNWSKMPCRPPRHFPALERADVGLDAGRRRDPQPGARNRGPSPAFPFDRRTRFPAPTCKRHGLGARRRGWEERTARSRAQPPSGGEHGEASEHRTFTAASTVERSAAVGGSFHGPPRARGDATGKEGRYEARATTTLTLTGPLPPNSSIPPLCGQLAEEAVARPQLLRKGLVREVGAV